MLPWTEVNALDSHTVAMTIGLPKREKSERRKWGCPACGSSDGLHAYPGPRAGFGCWAACGADQPRMCRGYSNVDIAGLLWGIRPAEACRRLAAAFGISVHDASEDGPHPRGDRPRWSTPRPSAQESNMAALCRIPGARRPRIVYSDLLSRLRLTARGTRYLTGRSLDPDTARTYGYRSIDDSDEWEAMARYLRRTYRREELAAAGFPLANHEGSVRVALPFNGRLPCLVIPYQRGGEVIGLRVRNILPDDPRYKHNRYRTLKGAPPAWPYHSDALRASTVHICEGELNAETLRQLGEQACGLSGAGMWLDSWTGELAQASEIVDWHDCTDPKHAGDRGAASLRSRLVASYGEEWVASRWRRLITDADPNALHQQDRLVTILHERPWRGARSPEVPVP